jgi:hypothetical protein
MDKCGGSSLVEYFKLKPDFKIHTGDFTEEFIKKLINNNYKFYAVIRSPDDRYITALNEFMYVYLKKFYRNSLYFIEKHLAENKFIFDDHTIPLSHRLQDLISYGADLNLIKFDKNLSSKIPQVINENDLLPTIHATNNKPFNENYYNFCTKMFEKYCVNNTQFFTLYKNDYNLYELSL